MHGEKGAEARIGDVTRNVAAELHGGVGDVAAGFAEADIVREVEVRAQRVQHAHLETHGSIAWTTDDGRLHVRTSSQVPFLVRDELAWLFSLGYAPSGVRYAVDYEYLDEAGEPVSAHEAGDFLIKSLAEWREP